MPAEQELMRLGSTELAVMCQRVEDDPARYTEDGVAAAAKLKGEWASLQVLPRSSLKEQQEVEQKQAALKKRMATFLAGIL